MRGELYLAYTVVTRVPHMPTMSDAIAAMKAGRRDEARVMLARILANDRNNVSALLWMTEFAATPEEVRMYLERVLSIDPANGPARRGLELLDKANEEPVLAASSERSPGQPVPDDPVKDYRISTENRTAQESMKLCPFCHRANLADSPFCKYCGHKLVATTVVKLEGAPTRNASNVDTVAGIIIALLIIVGLFLALIGFSQMRMAYLGIATAAGLTDATENRSRLLALEGILCFVLAVANLVLIKSVVERRRGADRWLIGIAAIGGVGAFLLAVIGSPGAIMGVPLFIIVAYLASTIKGAFSQ